MKTQTTVKSSMEQVKLEIQESLFTMFNASTPKWEIITSWLPTKMTALHSLEPCPSLFMIVTLTSLDLEDLTALTPLCLAMLHGHTKTSSSPFLLELKELLEMVDPEDFATLMSILPIQTPGT